MPKETFNLPLKLDVDQLATLQKTLSEGRILQLVQDAADRALTEAVAASVTLFYLGKIDKIELFTDGRETLYFGLAALSSEAGTKNPYVGIEASGGIRAQTIGRLRGEPVMWVIEYEAAKVYLNRRRADRAKADEVIRLVNGAHARWKRAGSNEPEAFSRASFRAE
jgi:hypothetical protein